MDRRNESMLIVSAVSRIAVIGAAQGSAALSTIYGKSTPGERINHSAIRPHAYSNV